MTNTFSCGNYTYEDYGKVGPGVYLEMTRKWSNFMKNVSSVSFSTFDLKDKKNAGKLCLAKTSFSGTQVKEKDFPTTGGFLSFPASVGGCDECIIHPTLGTVYSIIHNSIAE